VTTLRVRITIEGDVQGVGFRPSVHRHATALGLAGWVRNVGARVVIDATGERAMELIDRIRTQPPRHARIEAIRTEALPPIAAADGFRVEASTDDESAPRVLPDLAACDDCVAEVFDPGSRYYRYPFTNCAQCGPRFSIVERVPYDRANTTMRGFAMCAECRAEYGEPGNRRFHAQPTACPRCGPRLRLAGDRTPGEPLEVAVNALAAGRILALKGLGGFQLMVDATGAEAVRELRARKRRPHKPFAIMVRDLRQAREYCRIDAAESALLESPVGPIVLLGAHPGRLPAELAPGLRTLGVMLPTTPLHHLLLRDIGRPLVCTSGNLGDEPICIDDDEALHRLGGIADLFLLHDRPIRRPVDDPVARVIDGAPQCLRIGRGYAPLHLPAPGVAPALATGAHLKNTVAIGIGADIVVSQHVGDLDSTLNLDAMSATIEDLCNFHRLRPAAVACDLHPDYGSTRYAEDSGLALHPVQHHLAHALACMLEHDLRGPLLAVTWDGTGLGVDGTTWGGEFLRVERTEHGIAWSRIANLHPFRLPGGDAASRDPGRALAGLLWELPMMRSRIPDDLRIQLERRLNSPTCSSAGRLFDGIAALLGVCGQQTFQGQAPSWLEAIATDAELPGYPMPLGEGRLDWRPMLANALADVDAGASPGAISARFHATLAEGIGTVARDAGESTVVLTGGCFHNRRLTELALARLRACGCRLYIARHLPPDDGGISAGQLLALSEGEVHVSGRSRSH